MKFLIFLVLFVFTPTAIVGVLCPPDGGWGAWWQRRPWKTPEWRGR
jgi:hypothetical protein